MSKFKVGDKVKVIKQTRFFGPHGLDIGGVYEITAEHESDGFRLKSIGEAKDSSSNYVHKEEIEMYVEKPEFEDQWHLNDGKVEIPHDADKLEKDGSVVAFRYRKVKPFEFGDKVKHTSGKIYIVVGKDQPGLYRIIQENSIHSVTAFEGNLTKVNDD